MPKLKGKKTFSYLIVSPLEAFFNHAICLCNRNNSVEDPCVDVTRVFEILELVHSVSQDTCGCIVMAFRSRVLRRCDRSALYSIIAWSEGELQERLRDAGHTVFHLRVIALQLIGYDVLSVS